MGHCCCRCQGRVISRYCVQEVLRVSLACQTRSSLPLTDSSNSTPHIIINVNMFLNNELSLNDIYKQRIFCVCIHVTVSDALHTVFLLFSFCLKDFLLHFLQCKSAADEFFRLLYIFKHMYFAFIVEGRFHWASLYKESLEVLCIPQLLLAVICGILLPGITHPKFSVPDLKTKYIYPLNL